MKLCQTTADLQEEVALAKAAGKSIGLVPTMGALHEGMVHSLLPHVKRMSW